ncbi:MAG TPA: non-heme iron oxygenase ferredoxin subunit [Phycisphaerae bacterium]|nr:non-heme iron oxygenase ferredoxin subunit [Phycisphaerae bacterium]
MPEFIKVAKTSEVPPGKSKVVDLGGLRIALFNVDGRYFAIDDVCTHAGGSLSEGGLHGATVECPLHGARFDLATGRVLDPPAETDVAAYRVHIEGKDIMLEVGQASASE